MLCGRERHALTVHVAEQRGDLGKAMGLEPEPDDGNGKVRVPNNRHHRRPSMHIGDRRPRLAGRLDDEDAIHCGPSSGFRGAGSQIGVQRGSRGSDVQGDQTPAREGRASSDERGSKGLVCRGQV